MRFWRSSCFQRAQPSRTFSITCRGTPIHRDKLYEYTNGRFLVNEKEAFEQRHLKFNVDELCLIASYVGSKSSVQVVEKLEGGFSKALLLRKEDGSEVIAKLPFSIAGPPRYTTAAEVAVLRYVSQYTKVPVPNVLTWSSDPSNAVGAEYIIMEKAAGSQLVKKWTNMEDYSHFMLIKNLCALEAELAAVHFPGNGSLYLRESMVNSEAYMPLNSEIDPFGQFCIGPSCDRAWSSERKTWTEKGPWPNLSVYGNAIVRREIARIKRAPKIIPPQSPPRDTVEAQIALLEMAGDVMAQMDSSTLPGRFSWPTLWHTDLHMGNIYVSDDDPTQIVSLIDWQNVNIAPLFCQVRFPELLDVPDDYELGYQVPKLPQNINEMDPDDQDIRRFEHKRVCMAKAYEAASGFRNKNNYKALQLPSYFKELYVRCGEAWEEGVIPLRACLIEISQVWKEAGFSGSCPVNFSHEDVEKHEREFQNYSEYHHIREVARKCLGTDEEGWISPEEDLQSKKQQNEELLKLVMRNSADYGRTANEIRKIWPF